ncbi:hypothetical protein [Streptomyces sp. NPDC005799]|uniref:hypothetical protein n=1 Tax=Streptomyces sp. NPDC005799 TaxID=3154678 RepID=UPI0033E3BC8C
MTLRSEDLPRGDRFARWCELVDRALAPTRVTSAYADDFRASALFLDLGATRVSSLSTRRRARAALRR